ncbi:MAG: hypothetical protein ACM3VS_06055 [Candidatus Dadabacteria bacterium]
MKYFLLLSLLAFSVAINAQTRGSARIYAYKQGSSRGAAPRTNEQGEVTRTNKEANYNYYLYLVSRSRVYPSELWLNGQHYNVTYKKVVSPVVRENTNLPITTKKEILVPKTSSMVLQLTPVTTIEGKASVKVSEKLKKNELVVLYKQNGKFYYSSLDKLSILDSNALQ